MLSHCGLFRPFCLFGPVFDCELHVVHLFHYLELFYCDLVLIGKGIASTLLVFESQPTQTLKLHSGSIKFILLPLDWKTDVI